MQWRRTLRSVLLTVMALLALVQVAWATETQHFTIEPTLNPIYEGIIEEPIQQLPPPSRDVIAADAGYLDEEDAVAYLRQQIVKRNTQVALNVCGPAYATADEIKAYVSNVFWQAFEHTGVGTEGDYMLRHLSNYSCSISYYPYGSQAYYTLNFNVVYLSTAQQEAAVNAAVQTLLSQLDLFDKTDYEIVRGIYEYMCSNITYDYAAVIAPPI